MLSKRARALIVSSIVCVGGGAGMGCGSDGAGDPAAVTPDGGGTEASTSSVKIVSFVSSLPVVEFGGTATLSWELEGVADDLTIDGVSVSGKTSLPVNPVRRQTFTLRVLKAGAVVATAVTTVAARGIDVLAGDPRGPSNFDGPGNVAGFYSPAGVAIDSAGNAFIADSQNRQIRKVALDGTVTTIAGDPHAPRETVDGVGKAAHFSSPTGIAVHPSGFLYVTDSASHVVRKVLADGTVTTIAGAADVNGPTNAVGANARFYGPAGIVLLPSGDLLIADQRNCAIRKLATDLTVTTAYGVIGSCDNTDAAPAKFLTPADIARDSAGNLYVTDSCVVRQITPGGVVSTYAGGPDCGERNGARTNSLFKYLQGVAVDSANNVYVADVESRTVRKIANDQVTTFAGEKTAIGDSDGPATFNGFIRPQSLAVRPNGEVLVTDSYGNTVRAVTPAGVMSTLAGTHVTTGSADGPVGKSRLAAGNGLTVDADGSVVVTDLGNAFIGSVRRITREGVTSTIAGGGGVTGFLDGTGSDARFASPVGIAGDKNGTYFIAEDNSSTVRKLEPNGVVTTIAGIPGNYTSIDGPKGVGSLSAPNDVARDSKGNLYLVQYQPGIRKLSPDGTLTTLTDKSAEGYVDGDVSVARFKSPRALAIDASDNLFVADSGNFVVRKITPAGVVSTVAGTPKVHGYTDGAANTAQFGYLFGLAVDPTGNVFVSDYDADAIRKIASDGTVTTIVGTRGIRGTRPGPLPGSLVGPKGLALTAEGDLVVTTSAAVMQITAP